MFTKKAPTGELLGQVFWMRRGIKSQRESTLGELCEDSIAQSRREIGFSVTPRCTNCGRTGALLQRPVWAGKHIGLRPIVFARAIDYDKAGIEISSIGRGGGKRRASGTLTRREDKSIRIVRL